LTLWSLDAAGEVTRHSLLGPEVRMPHFTIASDFNGDGLMDLAVVDGNLATGPALVVLVGQRDGLPVLEGRYRLPGMGGEVLAGDLNGDRANDVIVLGRSVEGGPGGAFVFLNQGVPVTATAVETAATPSAFALGANYPNPFNLETWILYQLAAPADVVITIYSTNGQLVRTLEFGHQAVGVYKTRSRAAYWEDRNEFGEQVASGIYFYVLTARDFTATRKMLIVKQNICI